MSFSPQKNALDKIRKRMKSPNFELRPDTTTHPEEKAFHIIEINHKYKERMMKPLQVNQRLKTRKELGWTNTDVEEEDPIDENNQDLGRLFLVKRINELATISAYSEKASGAFKKHVKLRKRKDVDHLESHLDPNVYEYIKTVNEKVDKSKQSAIVKENIMSQSAQIQIENNIHANTASDEELSPKSRVQKQLEAVRENQDKSVSLKQLNADVQFRHSKRKLLHLRLMQSDPKSGTQMTTEQFFKQEAIREKERKERLKRGYNDKRSEMRTSYPMAKRQGNSEHPSTADHEFRSTQSSYKKNEIKLFNSDGNETLYKPYELGRAPNSTKEVKFETVASIKLLSMSNTTTPKAYKTIFDFKQKQINLNHETYDIATISDRNRPAGILKSSRASSHPLIVGSNSPSRSPKMFNHENSIDRNIPNYGRHSRDDHIETIYSTNPDSRTDTNIKQSALDRSLELISGGKIQKFIRIGDGSLSPNTGTGTVSRFTATRENTEDADAESSMELLGKRTREDFRTNLLKNIHTSKITKNHSHHESLNTNSTTLHTPVEGQWNSALFERKTIDSKGSPFRIVKKAKKKKIRRDRIDYSDEDLEADLMKEEIPLKVEMKGLLDKYGYQSSEVEIQRRRPVQKKPNGFGEFGSNKVKMSKADKLMSFVIQKATKVSKVD